MDSYTLRFTQGKSEDAVVPALQRQFLPTTFPPSGTTIPQRRAATSDILSFSARFGICTADVLAAIERKMIRSEKYGNICQLHGIFATRADGVPAVVPSHIGCHAVPKRLVQCANLCDDVYLTNFTHATKPHAAILVQHIQELVPVSLQHIPMRLPPLVHVEMLLRMILIHQASADSSQGYLLAMAVHLQSLPLICFLLAAGADPTLKGGISLHIAAKQGDLATLRLMVERDDIIEFQWRSRLRAIVEDLRALENVRFGGHLDQAPRKPLPALGAAPSKRRRLADRCQLDNSLFKSAIGAKAWEIVAYLMHTKGLVPDVDTLRMIDTHGMP